jgi:AbrB family looped-hinge helix DNA binding protein
MPVARVLGKGQIVIPKELREKVKLLPGDKVELKLGKRGIILLPLKKSYTEEYRGRIKGKLSLEELEKIHEEES